MTDVLILAGSAEAHALASSVPKARVVLPAPLRTGGGDVAYEIAPDWSATSLVAGGDGPVILATHPCDDALRADLPGACIAAGRSLLHLCRAPWRPGPGDDWHMLDNEAAVETTIPPGARVFVGLGRAVRRLEAYLPGRYLVIRQLGARGEVFDGFGHYRDAAAPFTVEEEIATLRAERINWLLLRNAGGEGARPKLDAARVLGLPVAMLPRPAPMPGVPQVETVAAAQDWLEAQL